MLYFARKYFIYYNNNYIYKSHNFDLPSIDLIVCDVRELW